jgi:hypothetical protein
MNILNLAILLIILFIIYNMYISKTHNSTNEKFYIVDNDDLCDDDVIKYDNDPSKYIDAILKSKHKLIVNDNFQEVQFNNDYRDTLDAFNLMSLQRPIFNKADLPITTVEKPQNREIRDLITNFIKELNKTVKNSISNTTNLNNWNSNMPEKKTESGWERQMKELGLPPSIYNDPARKSSVKLIKLDHAEKIQTDNEIKYVIYLIIQKRNTVDQMVVKISFVIDNNDVNLDRDFFDKKKNNYETKVNIEDISVVGFLLKNNSGSSPRTTRDKFYDVTQISDGKMFSQQDIVKELNKKRVEYQKEMIG